MRRNLIVFTFFISGLIFGCIQPPPITVNVTVNPPPVTVVVTVLGQPDVEPPPSAATPLPPELPTTPPEETPLPTEPSLCESPTTIMWYEANRYIGEFMTVFGPVVDTHFASSSGGQPTFLNLGLEHPDPGRFTILIWGDNRNKFPQAPDEFYFGKNICVSGLIEEYQGTVEIIVDDPAQITIP